MSTLDPKMIPMLEDKYGPLWWPEDSARANEDNMMLFEGLHILNEVNSVRRMLRFFNKNHKINDKEPGRLILLAPSFSNDLLAIANGISSVRIALYEWEYLQFGDEKALQVTPISVSQVSKNR